MTKISLTSAYAAMHYLYINIFVIQIKNKADNDVMKHEKKKRLVDLNEKYPILAFRFSEADRTEIMKEIAVLKGLLNQYKADNEKRILGNDIALEALRIGLKAIKRTIKK